jgi:hypothetical protein
MDTAFGSVTDWGIRTANDIQVSAQTKMIFGGTSTTKGINWLQKNSGADQIDAYINSAAELSLDATALFPAANGGLGVGKNGAGISEEWFKDASAAFEDKVTYNSSATLTADRDRIMDFPDSNTTLKIRAGSGVLDFGSLTAPSCEDLTVTVTGASDGEPCSVGVPNAAAPIGSQFTCWRSAANIVTIRHCCIRALAATCDPASATFRAIVMSL